MGYLWTCSKDNLSHLYAWLGIIVTPLEKLGLSSLATAEDVERRWRELRSNHHPDRGGDATIFHELNLAYQAARTEVSQPRPCQACNGTGRSEVRRGFGRVELMCTFCNGLGVEE